MSMNDKPIAAQSGMPVWPAWVLFATMAACAYPALAASFPEHPDKIETPAAAR